MELAVVCIKIDDGLPKSIAASKSLRVIDESPNDNKIRLEPKEIACTVEFVYHSHMVGW